MGMLGRPPVVQNFTDAAAALPESGHLGNSADEYKTYKNEHYNFSLEYPGDWNPNEGLDGNGVAFTPASRGGLHAMPKIGAGGHVPQPNNIGDAAALGEAPPQTLDEEFQSMLSAMRRGPGPAQNVVLLNQKHASFQGFPTLIATMRYVRPPHGDLVFSKLILIRTTGQFPRSYDLGLECHPDDVAVLLPVFDRIASSLRILGPPE